jgi:hypothetical protein
MSTEIKEGNVASYADLEKAYAEAESGETQRSLLLQVSYVPVNSSLLLGVQYIPGLELLLLVFKTNNHAYVYSNVPQRTYQELMEADSQGKYFYSHIKGKFEYEDLGEVHGTS